jgi:hypothetical protein
VPFNSIWISDPADGLLPGAVQEYWEQLTVVLPHDFFELLVLYEVVWINVAVGCDDKRNAMPRTGVYGRVRDAVYELPKPRSVKVEDLTREIDCRVIVEQPP